LRKVFEIPKEGKGGGKKIGRGSPSMRKECRRGGLIAAHNESGKGSKRRCDLLSPDKEYW